MNIGSGGAAAEATAGSGAAAEAAAGPGGCRCVAGGKPPGGNPPS